MCRLPSARRRHVQQAARGRPKLHQREVPHHQSQTETRRPQLALKVTETSRKSSCLLPPKRALMSGSVLVVLRFSSACCFSSVGSRYDAGAARWSPTYSGARGSSTLRRPRPLKRTRCGVSGGLGRSSQTSRVVRLKRIRVEASSRLLTQRRRGTSPSFPVAVLSGSNP